MKIVYLHQYFNTPEMSGGTRSYEMARRFVKAGHEVHVVASYRENDKLSRDWWVETLEGFNIHWFAVPYSNKLTYGKRIQAFFRFAWEAAKKAHQIGGDIIFATSTPLTIALPGIYASKRLKIPMVFEVRDLWPEIPIAVGALNNYILIKMSKWLEKYAYCHSSHIVALSPGMASGVSATGFPQNKITVIPNGADINFFNSGEDKGQLFLAQYPELSSGPLVLYAGTLGLINGVGYMVDIAIEMQRIDPAVRFLIVGDGQEFSMIEKKATEGGVLRKNLWMLPPVSKNEMPGLLSAATVTTSFVVDIPELWNNSANKFFDSLAAGKPIMINYQGWQARLLEESGAGLVVPPCCAEKAAILLHGFLLDERRLENGRIAARQLAETQFDRDVLSAQLLSVLEKTVGCAGTD